MTERYMFRGKRTDNGEWVEGFFHIVTKGEYLKPIQNGYYITAYKELENGEIILTGCFEVDPATIGQCAELRDKNGKLIFEGDVLGCYDLLCRDFFTGVVSFGDGSFVIKDKETTHYRWLDYETEILGNIHDNPELLEKDGDGE